ncbi:MAG: ABC transporter permease subunit [Leptospiraceae bacterium]|nr:ABC transporter permease subunit [Leptospiraceae bacterium]
MKLRFAHVAALLLVAALTVQLTINKPAIHLSKAFAPPSLSEPFGTTPLGQSMLAMVLSGAGQTLGLSVAALLISLLLSLFAAGLLYLFPLRIRGAFAYLIDAWLAIPGIFIALSVGYFLPQSFFSVMFALILSEFAALQKFFLQRLDEAASSDYITMARVMGGTAQHTLMTHVLPRLAREAGYLFFLTLPSMTLSLASLEFLGVQTGSDRLSLGMQIAVYKDYVLLYPHLSLAPVACLLLLLFLLNSAAKLVKRDAYQA